MKKYLAKLKKESFSNTDRAVNEDIKKETTKKGLLTAMKSHKLSLKIASCLAAIFFISLFIVTGLFTDYLISNNQFSFFYQIIFFIIGLYIVRSGIYTFFSLSYAIERMTQNIQNFKKVNM